MKGNWEEIDGFKEMTVSASLLERTKNKITLGGRPLRVKISNMT